MNIVLILLIGFFGNIFAAEDEQVYFQNGCTIYSHGEIHPFPGQMCVFQNDGSIFSSAKVLRKLKPDGSVAWETNEFLHHQLNLSPDGKRLFTLGSEVITENGKKLRDDILFVVDAETGAILHRKRAAELRQETKLSPFSWPPPEAQTEPPADIEVSHFNSIYEIPDNTSKAPYLKAKNVIANSSGHGYFVLSPDLSKVLHHEILSFSRYHRVHDVQVNREGKILLFNNTANITEDVPHSAVQEYDPVTKRITYEFTASPKPLFYSPACGGVQIVDTDKLFISHIVTGGYLISKKTKTILRSTLPTADPIRMVQSQQIKMIDARMFLKKARR